MTSLTLLKLVISLLTITTASAFSFLPPTSKSLQHTTPTPTTTRRTPLQMIDIDPTVVQGAGVAAAGLAAGFGLIMFTEDRALDGDGLSDGMSTRISGKLMEDVEVSSVADLGSLTSQLENALNESTQGKVVEELTEEEKAKIAADLDDGW